MIVIAMKRIFSYVNDHCRTVCGSNTILLLYFSFLFFHLFSLFYIFLKSISYVRFTHDILLLQFIFPEPIEKSWSTDCNKTIILSHNHLRASIWSPGFPSHYPDKTNCFTVIIAPKGFYIAIEFEEFVLENEPQYVSI